MLKQKQKQTKNLFFLKSVFQPAPAVSLFLFMSHFVSMVAVSISFSLTPPQTFETWLSASTEADLGKHNDLLIAKSNALLALSWPEAIYSDEWPVHSKYSVKGVVIIMVEPNLFFKMLLLNLLFLKRNYLYKSSVSLTISFLNEFVFLITYHQNT